MLLYSIIQIILKSIGLNYRAGLLVGDKNLFCDTFYFYYSSNLEQDWTRHSLVIAANV